MKFSLAIPAAVLALAGAAAALADIRGWTDAECKGSSIGCVGIGEGQCCGSCPPPPSPVERGSDRPLPQTSCRP